MIRTLLLLVALCLMLPATALAIAVEKRLDDPQQEARAVALFKEMRCVVCTSESLYDSKVPLARDVRRVIRTQIEAGKSDAAIRAYLVDRYGEEILFSPPVNSRTLALWLLPLLGVVFGGAVLFFLFRTTKSAR